jgi:SSS family solute:Na+ symporter
VLQVMYPIAIPELGGLTSGVAALVVNFAVYIAVSYARPSSSDETDRVNELFDSLHASVPEKAGQAR